MCSCLTCYFSFFRIAQCSLLTFSFFHAGNWTFTHLLSSVTLVLQQATTAVVHRTMKGSNEMWHREMTSDLDKRSDRNIRNGRLLTSPPSREHRLFENDAYKYAFEGLFVYSHISIHSPVPGFFANYAAARSHRNLSLIEASLKNLHSSGHRFLFGRRRLPLSKH
uniref:Uncharacterized protein n=1 Tax=Rhipicephalus zambeziensis TaxID=60191 RepID=A0A224YI36_9ACAR